MMAAVVKMWNLKTTTLVIGRSERLHGTETSLRVNLRATPKQITYCKIIACLLQTSSVAPFTIHAQHSQARLVLPLAQSTGMCALSGMTLCENLISTQSLWHLEVARTQESWLTIRFRFLQPWRKATWRFRWTKWQINSEWLDSVQVLVVPLIKNTLWQWQAHCQMASLRKRSPSILFQLSVPTRYFQRHLE